MKNSNPHPPQLYLESEQQFRTLVHTAPVGIILTNQAGEIVLANAKAEEMFGYQSSELEGQMVEILLPESLRQGHVTHRTGYLSGLHVRPMGGGLDLIGWRKDGTGFPVEIGLGFITTTVGPLISSFITDITERKRAEAMLHETERRRQVAEGLRDTLTVLNSARPLEETLDYIVSQAVDLFEKANACAICRLDEAKKQFVVQASYGLSAEYVAQANIPVDEGTIGHSILTRRLVAISDVGKSLSTSSEEAKLRRQVLLTTGHRAYLAVPLLVKDKVYGSLILYYAQPNEFSEEDFALAVMFSDQAALAIENSRLRTQAERMAVAAERNRLARDLHDSVTQTLFSASVIADVLPRLWETNRAEGERRSAELRELTRGALAEMRTLLLELRPAKLVEIPLSDLLKQLTEATIGRARLPIKLEIEGECSLPPDVQIALYRIAQEALNNIAKHARAEQAIVTFRCQSRDIALTIWDDGVGFEMMGIKPENLGLTIMKERAEEIAARLDIQSQIGQGTKVSVRWHNINETTKDQ